MRNLHLSLLGLAVAAALLVGAQAQAAVHIVNANGFAFDAADITIQVGDTVQWVNVAGVHTVTSGTGSTDPNSGALFNSPLSVANPTFEFTFNSPGDVPYYCAPHELFGMTGIVRVQAGAAVPAMPGGPALLIGGLLLGSAGWMRRVLRSRSAQA